MWEPVNQAIVAVCPIWLIGSIIAGSLHSHPSPTEFPSFHGMWSSLAFYALPIVVCFCPTVGGPRGFVAAGAAHLGYISFRFWELHRLDSWPVANLTSLENSSVFSFENATAELFAETGFCFMSFPSTTPVHCTDSESLKAGEGVQIVPGGVVRIDADDSRSGYANKDIISHDDSHAMLFLACGVVGLCVESVLRAARGERDREAWFPAAAGVAASSLCSVMIQLALRVGNSVGNRDVGALIGLVAVALILFIATRVFEARRSQRWRLFVLDAVLLPLPLLSAFLVHWRLGKKTSGKPDPAFDDLLASLFHFSCAAAVAFLVLLPPDDSTRSLRRATWSSAMFLLTPLALVPPVYCLRDTERIGYYGWTGALFAVWAAAMILVAIASERRADDDAGGLSSAASAEPSRPALSAGADLVKSKTLPRGHMATPQDQRASAAAGAHLSTPRNRSSDDSNEQKVVAERSAAMGPSAREDDVAPASRERPESTRLSACRSLLSA